VSGKKITTNDLEICIDQNINFICPRARFSDLNSVDKAREKNILVRNWGVSDKNDLITAYKSESSGTTLDWPLKGQDILKKIDE